jgi:8-oxo-dGTP pyrophosphatase MutT (NUDIX family)
MEQCCNNCGKSGHMYHQCKVPITSIGVIAFRVVEGKIQYLMIRRKDTLGNIDLMRGKYSVANKYYIMNMLNQMTLDEKERLKSGDFNELWRSIWEHTTAVFHSPHVNSQNGQQNKKSHIYSQYQSEETSSREKYNYLFKGVNTKYGFYTLNDLIEESNQITQWTETEWGFPKGRRNHQENDFDCAMREFTEETGYSTDYLHNMQNILPYEEIFTGSNYKSYKHKYFIMCAAMEDKKNSAANNYDRSEVSKLEWKTYEECMRDIRPYNLEKKRLITNVNEALTRYQLYLQ